ncbi:MAG: SdrD B-like domain-containing protein, partial [Bacteroidota bacterium]
MTCLRYIFLNVLILIAYGLMGQQCETVSFGNTYIHAGGEANVFGRHTFAEGSMGVIPGIVGTERAGVMGVLSFAEVSPGWIGAGDDTHVDGYVRSYRNGGFVFPIGDNGSYRPAATQGDGVVTAAYFGIDPSLAVTTDLFGGDFPILPIGGPFPSAATSGDLFRVSQQEYWDIDSDSLQQITLTWDIFSNINNLTGGDLNRLSIVGYDGSQWVAIPSSLDVLFLNDQSTTPQFNAGISSRVQGSITTTGSVRPNDFLAFTFGAVASGFIGDFVWDDLNRNGVQEQGEPGIPGTLVRLFDDRDNLVDSIRSDANGRYTFQGVPPGRYYLAFTPPDGYNVTLPGQGLADLNSDIGFNSETFVFLLGANKIDFSLDAGFYRSASIGNLVWLDSNGDGIQGDDELNVPQVRVDLLNPNGDLLASTISDEFGFYQFTN